MNNQKVYEAMKCPVCGCPLCPPVEYGDVNEVHGDDQCGHCKQDVQWVQGWICVPKEDEAV